MGIGPACTGPFSYVSWHTNPEVEPYPYDPAGNAHARGGRWKDVNGDGILEKEAAFHFTILTNQGNGDASRIRDHPQKFQEAGIDAKIR